MSILEIINKKKIKKSLTKEECFFFIDGVINSTILDYQISSLLMAICINGMTNDEIIWFTEAICHFSKKINPIATNYRHLIIDKHSSGGIGDKVSLIISPILSSLGYDVVKLSGRGLGYTGGTIDKLESIGISCKYNENTFQSLLEQTHIMIMLQSHDLVPADKKMYAIRNCTSTVDSLPLIAISIMAKKLIISSDYISLDIKYGAGAFCKNLSQAQKLREYVLMIAHHFSRSISVHLSDMNQPLGRCIGNAIEITECIDFLRNKSSSKQLHDFIYSFCVDILCATAVASSTDDAYAMVDTVIKNQTAYESFLNFVNIFSSNPSLVQNNSYFHPNHSLDIFSPQSGHLSFSSTEELGWIVYDLGSGHTSINDKIDHQSGIRLYFDSNDYVEQNSCIATIYSNSPIDTTTKSRFLSLLVFK